MNVLNDSKESFDCVICFEKMDELKDNFKFSCNHAKFMHNHCIESLNRCPLCRISANAEVIIVYQRNHLQDSLFSLICTAVCCLIFLIGIYTEIHDYNENYQNRTINLNNYD